MPATGYKGHAIYGKGTFQNLNTSGFSLDGTALTATASELNDNDLSAKGAVKRYLTVSLAAGTVTTAASTLGAALPANAWVQDVFLKVDTASSAANTLTIGTTATAAGFINALSIASTGLFRPGWGTATNSTDGQDFYPSPTRGSLLYGGQVGTSSYALGTLHEVPHALTAAASIAGSLASASALFAGSLVFEYVKLST